MSKLKHKEESKLVKTIRLIKNIFFAVILVLLTGVIILTLVTRISGKTPSILGYTMYRVSSGSMEPTLKVGDIILSSECDPMTLKKDDIITYDGTVGEFKDKRVTHRVVKAPYKDSGSYYLVTKGDDNPVEDSPINVSQVRGKYVAKIDILRWLYEFFITPWGLLTLIALIILAFSNEIITLVKVLFGKGYEPPEKDSIEDIIERYQKENLEKERLKQIENPSKRKLNLMKVQAYKSQFGSKRLFEIDKTKSE